MSFAFTKLNSKKTDKLCFNESKSNYLVKKVVSKLLLVFKRLINAVTCASLEKDRASPSSAELRSILPTLYMIASLPESLTVLLSKITRPGDNPIKLKIL